MHSCFRFWRLSKYCTSTGTLDDKYFKNTFCFKTKLLKRKINLSNSKKSGKTKLKRFNSYILNKKKLLSKHFKGAYQFYLEMESQSIRTLQKKRTSNFREDETKLLIQLWGSPCIQKKLYLTHRKAPVMRILAANMQQRGFYRTPDEIKTRIRNLKCLYHRIKRSTASGTGVGTIDPDWPHFKAMDAILSKEGLKKAEQIDDGVLEGPRCEDIKQEIEIDINDDMESWVTNDSVWSENSDEPPPLPKLKPAPTVKPEVKVKESQIQPKSLPTVLPSFTLPQQTATKPGAVPSIPLPLLILNSLQPQQTVQDKNKSNGCSSTTEGIQSDLHNVLKELLEVQKENLEIEKQKLEIEKQRLEFDRVVGSQLLTLVPMIGGIIQRLALNQHDTNTLKNRKRKASESIFKDSKILRSVLEQGLRKCMLEEEEEEAEDPDEEKDSETEDNGEHNEENSSSKE